jgi:hypothetical protein
MRAVLHGAAFLARLPNASPELSQLCRREEFPPAAGGPAHEARPAEAKCEDG